MLKPVQSTEEEKGLLFAIEGKEWNLYSATSNLNEIKNTFINCPADNKQEGMTEYKYIGLTKDDTMEVDTFVVTYNNKFIILDEALVGKCIFPIRAEDLSDMISELAEHYRKLGYEIIVRSV